LYYNPLDDPVGKRVLPAFHGAENLWRTVGGVARETGLPAETVQSYINSNPGLFVQSTLTASGSGLYGLRDEVKGQLFGNYTRS